MTTQTTTTKPARAKRFARESETIGANSAPTAVETDAATAPSPKVNKTEEVIALLRREEGATLAEITGATGWLPHSARAALTGLRKKGHAIEKAKRSEVTCYSIKVGA